jgi:hypothetical protein
MTLERNGTNNELNSLPSSVEPLFLAAGWSPGRRIAVPEQIPAHHPACQVLAEFGGLNVGRTGLGEECAASDIAFRQLVGDSSFVRFWSEQLHACLIGVAEVHNAHGELYVDTIGRWFVLSLTNDSICFTGSSFSEAMERLLLGRLCRPMLRPDQDKVSIYGKIITADDPRVYHYS